MKKSIRYSLVSYLIILALLLPSCAPKSTITAGDLGSLTAALDAEAPRLLEKYKTESASIALVVDGKLAWSKSYGVQDKEASIPASPQTVYQIASISKTMAAWGVMQLVEQGKLDLDAPASRYLTRWQIPAPAVDGGSSAYSLDGVTIRRLLSHSAGLSVHGYPGYEPGAPLPSLEESLSGKQGPNYAVQLVNEPGKAYSYSGGGYTLLQLIVEEVSGQTFEDYVQDALFTPLGLAQTSFTWRDDLQAATARAYDMDGKRLPNYLFTEKAAAGVYTNVTDLAQFGAAFVEGASGEPAGRGVLSAESLAEMGKVQIAIPASSAEGYLSGMDGYGFGLFVETLPDGSKAINHTGGNKGWRSLLAIAPEQRAVLAVLTNSDNGGAVHDEIRVRWADWLGAGTPKGIQHMATLSGGIVAFSVLLLVGFGAWLVGFARQITQGKRALNRKPNLRTAAGWRAVLRVVLAVLLAGVWIFLGSLFVSLIFPAQAGWVSAAALAWIAALAASGLTTRRA